MTMYLGDFRRNGGHKTKVIKLDLYSDNEALKNEDFIILYENTTSVDLVE